MPMTLISGEIIERLKEAGITAKKSLGQNFLVNEGIYHKIVGALEIKSSDTIVEVGPGLGTLTDYLAETGAKIIAVEKDRRLIDYLKKRFEDNPRIEIVEDDILKFAPSSYKLPATSYKLVGNIPFYLTSHLIRTVFEEWPQPENIVLMLQKEVAQRIVAKPPKMSLLSVSVQYHSKPKIVGYVSKGSFYPQPKVDSAIIRLENRKEKVENRKDTEKFFKIARAGFAGKRKQLGNNLSSALKLPRQEVDAKLLLAAVAPQRRAETLTIEEWQKITKIFF